MKSVKWWLLSGVAMAALSMAGCGSTPVAARSAQERWMLFPSGASYYGITSINKRYLWMRPGLWCGQVSRYDMQTRIMTTYTDRDGLPLSMYGVRRLVADDGERALLLLENHTAFIHESPGKWRQLPPVPEPKIQDVAFDTDGAVLALVAPGRHSDSVVCRVMALDEAGNWMERREATVPRAVALVPLANGYVIKGYDGKSALYCVSKATDGVSSRLQNAPIDENGLRYFRIAGKTYMATPTRTDIQKFPAVRAMQTVREITETGVTETRKETPQMLDLTTGTFQPISFDVRREEKQLVCRSDQFSPLTLDFHTGVSLFPVRDKNGDVWLYRCAFIDGEWVIPNSPRRCISDWTRVPENDFLFDDNVQQWRTQVPEELGRFSWHAKEKLAWTMLDYNSPDMQLWAVNGREPRLVRTVSRQPDWHLPDLMDPKGNWWIRAKRNGVIRLDPDGAVSRHAEGRVSWIGCSPKTDDIWIRTGTAYQRYDERTDRFVLTRGAPYDDFSFRVGSEQLSHLPSSRVMRNVLGKWDTRGRGGSYITRCGNRVLLSGPGTWEYDITLDRWVLLHLGTFHVGFDPKGRRVLANPCAILLYDGDPFDDPGYQRYRPVIQAQRSLLHTYIDVMAGPNPAGKRSAKERFQQLSPLVYQDALTASADGRLPENIRKELATAAPFPAGDGETPSLFGSAFLTPQ